MQVECKHCGYVVTLSQRKYRRKDLFIKSATKITTCTSCGKKIFYTILEKYNQSDNPV